MTWVLLAVVVLVAAVAAMWLVGSLLPRGHTATRVARYRQAPEAIWAAIVGVEEMPSWRTGLRSVSRRPDVDGRPSWVETSSHGDMPIVVVDTGGYYRGLLEWDLRAQRDGFLYGGRLFHVARTARHAVRLLRSLTTK